MTIEPVDDIPVLLTSMARLGLAELVDQHFPRHGNWQGLSPGQVLTGWLAYILSEGDHRLNQAQDWAADRLAVLCRALGGAPRALDFSDDRLASGLDLLSDDRAWGAFEAALNRRTLRVYDLKRQRVRLDTTSASGCWAVTEDGLFQFGHNKDQRPDLAQVKVMLAILDPLGLPLATQAASSEKADDPLYIPAIDQVRRGVGQRGVTGLLTLTYSETVHERHVRKYGARPAEPRTERTLQLAVARDDAAIETAERRLGWRVYGANQPAAELMLEQAVLGYRDEYLVERGFGRLKGAV